MFGDMWFTRCQFTGQMLYGNSPENSTHRLVAKRSIYGDCKHTQWKCKITVNEVEFTAYHHTLYGSIKSALKMCKEYYA